MEQWDLLNGEREPMGITHVRGTPLPPGTYHAIVFVWVANREGKFLLTRRAPEKKTYPNCWGCTGGAVLAGESSRRGAVRELWEETGLTAESGSVQLVCTVREQDMFSDIYFLSLAQWPVALRLQPGETVEAGWFTLDEIDALPDLADPDRRRLESLRDVLAELAAESSAGKQTQQSGTGE